MKHFKILYIDDDEFDHEVFADHLKHTGLSVDLLKAKCVDSAKFILENQVIDIVFLDLHVPPVSGMETIGMFEKEMHYTPFIVLTGMQSDELAMKALDMGCQDYFYKGELSPKPIKRMVLHSVQRHRKRNGTNTSFVQGPQQQKLTNIVDELTMRG